MQIAVNDFIEMRNRSDVQILVIALVSAITVLDGFDLQLLPFTAPLILKEWGVSKLVLSPAIGAALIGMAAGTLLGGSVGDRYGRRPSLICSVGIFGISTLVCATVQTPIELTLVRILSGIGFGASFSSATALVAEWCPRRTANRTIGMIFVGVPVGGLLAGFVAIAVLPIWGWRGAFVVGGVMSLGYAPRWS